MATPPETPGPAAGNSRSFKRLIRLRMAETGEKYTAAMRALQADPAEVARLRGLVHQARQLQRYPFTDRDGLDGRHVLSAWETARRGH